MTVMFLKHWLTTVTQWYHQLSLIVMRTLKARFIPHKFSTGCPVGVVKSVEKKKSVAVRG